MNRFSICFSKYLIIKFFFFLIKILYFQPNAIQKTDLNILCNFRRKKWTEKHSNYNLIIKERKKNEQNLMEKKILKKNEKLWDGERRHT